MSNMTQLDTLLQKIVDLENEIIEKNKIITKNKEEMDNLQEAFKNLVKKINETLEAINGN